MHDNLLLFHLSAQRNYPSIRCFECDEYGHIVMDMSTQDTSFGNHSKAAPTQTTQKPQAPGTTMRTGTGKVIPGYNHIFTDTTDQVIMIHIEAIPGHNIGIIVTTPGVAHNAQVPQTEIIAINPAITHHIDPTTDHLHTEAHHHTTPETKVTHIHVHPTNPQDEIHIANTHTPADHEANHITRRTPK